MKQAVGLVMVICLFLHALSMQSARARTESLLMQAEKNDNSLAFLNRNPGAIYLSDFQTAEEAMRTWEKYKTHIPILYLFHPFAMSGSSESKPVRLIAMIRQIDIPTVAAYKIMRDTCISLQNQNFECTPFEFEMNIPQTIPRRDATKIDNDADVSEPSALQETEHPVEELDLVMSPQSLYRNQPVDNAASGKWQDQSENSVSDPKHDTVAQAAMRAAYDMVRNRYADAIYQAQLNDGDVDIDSEDAIALTKDALSYAADRAFEQFMQDYYGTWNLEGQTYDGLKGYFVSAFKHAAATSIKSVGKRFVRDATSSGDFKSLAIRSQILDGMDENIASAFIETGLVAAKNSQYAFLKNLEVTFKLKENRKPEYKILTLQPLYSSAGKKHNMYAQAGYAYDGERSSVTGGVGYRYLPPSEDYVVGANAFLDYEYPYDHQRASLGLDLQTSLWGVSANYYKGLTEWRDARTGYEERAMDGMDVEVAGRMPFLPALEVSGRAYRWQAFDDAADIYGQEYRLAYSPVPAFTVEASLNDEDGQQTDFGMAVRYNYIFGAPQEYLYDWEEQFRQKSASEYIFAKARRENEIRVQERIDEGFAAANAIAPGLLAASPTDGATGLSVGIDVTLTFDTDVLAGAGNIVFTDLTDGSGDFSIPVGDPRVTIVNDTVTIDLSAQIFEFNTNYDITMASGVFTDTSATPFGGLASGDLDFTTVVDPTAGFPAATVSMAPGTTTTSHENAQDIGTWETIIDIGGAPDGVIFESGATGQGIAASFGGGNLVFAAGDGASTATGTDSIFGTYPIASIPQGLHHFTFVADPDAPAEIGMYLDGIRVINQSIAGGMQGGEWAGTNGAGYGLVNSAIRAGVDTSAISGATLISNLTFYTNVAPADF